MLHTYLRQDQVHINWNVYISFQLRQTWSCHARSESASMAVSMMVDTAKKNHIYSLVCYLKVQEINLWGNHCFSSPPPKKKLGDVSCFWNLNKEGGHEKIAQKRGLVERGGFLLERGGSQIVSSVFLQKSMFSLLSGLILTTYSMQYPHTVPFLRNKVPYSLLKPPKTHAV